MSRFQIRLQFSFSGCCCRLKPAMPPFHPCAPNPVVSQLLFQKNPRGRLSSALWVSEMREGPWNRAAKLSLSGPAPSNVQWGWHGHLNWPTCRSSPPAVPPTNASMTIQQLWNAPALTLRASRYPEELESAQFTACSLKSPFAGSKRSAREQHRAPGKETIVHGRDHLMSCCQDKVQRNSARTPLTAAPTKDQRIKISPVNVNALVLRMIKSRYGLVWAPAWPARAERQALTG